MAALLFMVLLCVPSSASGLSVGPRVPVALPHNVHVSRGRMAVEGGRAVVRIRFFRHDLEAALAAHHAIDSFSLSNTSRSDSLFLEYLTAHFSVLAGNRQLDASISTSGEDGEVWWFELNFSQRQPIESLAIRNEMLFELFPDQKHFLKVTFFPSGNSRSFYFVAGSAKYEISPFED